MSKVVVWLACTTCVASAAVADPPPLQDPATGSNNSAGTDWAAVTAQANAQTAAYNAMAAAANAQKAMYDAQADAAKAKYGGIPPMTGLTAGSVDAGTEGPKAEAMLLATRATEQAADRLAGEIAASMDKSAYKDRQLIILTGLNELSASDAVQFDAQTVLLRTQLSAANQACTNALRATDAAAKAAEGGAGGQQRMFFPAVGALLNAGANIASYFQTDYKFGSVAITEPTNLTAAAVAAALRQKAPSHRLLIPANVLVLDAKPVLDVMGPLQSDYEEAVVLAAQARARSANVKSKSPEAAAVLDAAVAEADKAIALFEAFASALVKSDSGKPAPIVSVLQQKVLQADMMQHPLVLLLSSSKVGAFYTKKNMWTFLAASPQLYTMGGVSLTYSVFDPADGVVLVSGVIPIHGGYQSVSQTQKLFSQAQ